VQEGATGFLVPERQPLALAGALSRLLANPELVRSLGAAGHERAAQLFAIEKSAQALRALFHRLGAL
jgi:glycosyltransferase involved in cell wall biosynthesis